VGGEASYRGLLQLEFEGTWGKNGVDAAGGPEDLAFPVVGRGEGRIGGAAACIPGMFIGDGDGDG
jgi:hypothetical protein